LSRRVFSGVQPTGTLHIGNYLGAIQQFTELQQEEDCLFCIVDLHALTVPQDPVVLREATLKTAGIYLASGIDPKKATVFIQSSVGAHAELAWFLNCIATFGELNRMTQFKEKSTNQETVSSALFTYPVLMAADILLYQTDVVPVGDDQKQHLELSRDIAQRFNHRYGETFKVPEPKILGVGSRIMGLDDASKKMSKSADTDLNRIELLDSPDVIRKKIKRAVTDSGRDVYYDEENKAAVSNLMTIYSRFSGDSLDTIQERYAGKGYGDFKKDLAEVVVEGLRPLRGRYEELSREPQYLLDILKEGAEKAGAIAEQTMKDVKEKVGIVRL